MSEKIGSRILYPFKIVGLVCGSKRILLNRLGEDSFLTVPVGKSFQVYNTKRLQLVMASPQLSKEIDVIEVSGEYTFTVVGTDILKWKRFSVTGVFHADHGSIKCLLLLGDYLLSASQDGYLCVWNWDTEELIRTINLGPDFHPSFLMHPTTYLNKVVIGGDAGQLQLWNIRTGSLIMNFRGYSSPITFIEQSPSVDVVAVGLSDGTIDILNLQFDQSVMEFHQSSAVTGLSFFSNFSRFPLLLSAGFDGSLSLWDIKTRSLRYQVDEAHESFIHSAFFLPGEFHFFTAGNDNSLRIWQLDEIDGSPQVLKGREGHREGASLVQFYGYNGVVARDNSFDGLSLNILSAGVDRSFRTFHVIREQLAAELSQVPYMKRAKLSRVIDTHKHLPPIVCFAYSEGRERDWANIVTCHENCVDVYTWKYLDRVMGNRVLSPPEEQKNLSNYATCCDIENAGETVVVGYREGNIHLFNIQSGMYRGSLPREAKKGFIVKQGLLGYIGTGSQEAGTGGHSEEVVAVGIDVTGQEVYSVSRDRTVRFWNIAERRLDYVLQLPSPAVLARYCRSANLLGILCSEGEVLVVECTSRQVIRRLIKLQSKGSCLSFSEDGRWLLVGDSCGDLRIWNVPSGRLLDWVRFEDSVCSVAMSCTSEFIATTHTGKRGIRIWANNAFYSDLLEMQEPREPCMIDLPDREQDLPQNHPIPAEIKVRWSDVAGGTLQLSRGPRGKWRDLSRLQEIHERNKAKEPVQKPESAPFFLPTAPGIVPQFVPAQEEEKVPESRVMKREEVLEGENALQSLLRRAVESEESKEPMEVMESEEAGQSETQEAKSMESIDSVEDEEDIRSAFGSFYGVLDHFRKCSVNEMDVELSMLCMGEFDTVGIHAVQNLMRFLEKAMEVGVEFEMVQAILERTLQLYGELIEGMPEMKSVLERMERVQGKEWMRMQGLMQQTLCLVELFSNLQL